MKLTGTWMMLAMAWLWSSLAVRNGLDAGRQMVSTAETRMTVAEISASRSKLSELTQELTQVTTAIHQ